MLTVLVDTFGQEVRVKNKEIGDYLKKFDIKIQSPSLPFRSIEPVICWAMIVQKKNGTLENMAYLGYHIGSADVPCIPIFFIGEPEGVPKEMMRLHNVICVEPEKLEGVLKPFIAAFSNSKFVLEGAVDLPVDGRIKLRKKLTTETLKAMEEYGYIEEYKKRL